MNAELVTSEPSLFYSPFSFGRRVVWGRQNVLPFGSLSVFAFSPQSFERFHSNRPQKMTSLLKSLKR
jgi:hypothetical protein